MLAFSLLGVAQTCDGAAPPNVVIILADDLGYGDLGCYGNAGAKTPNLDRMASEGMRFTDFYVAQPVCSASRAALLTGCYPNRIGIAGALGPNARHGINSKEVTIAEMLKSRGYSTAIFGKWHLGHHPEFLPTRHGFDEYFGLPYSNDMWPHHPGAKAGTYPPLPLLEGEKIVNANVTSGDQSQLTTWYAERAVKFIEKNKERPFFLYLAHSMPHVPLHVSDKHKDKSGTGLHGDVIMEIDWSVGQVLDALKRHDLDNNTLVVFTSDNGPWLSYGNHAGSALPLREGKGTTWEGGVRVPCLARWPGHIPANQRCSEPAMTMDLFPTIAALDGRELPTHEIDGLNIWPLLEGRRGAVSPHEALFFYYGHNELQAIRSGRWKFYLPHTYVTLGSGPGGMDGKPAPYQNRKMDIELYDLSSDVGEKTNVAPNQPEVVKRLEQLAQRCRLELGDSLVGAKGAKAREPGRLPREKD